MFRYSALLLFALFLTACGDAEPVSADNADPATAAVVPAPAAKEVNEGTLLCQVNGQPWHYTKASGIITTERKSGKRTAIITFKKKLEKGSESIQLYYNAETFEMEKAALQLKRAKTDGGKMTGFYNLGAETANKLPGHSVAGTIDLSNAATAAGTATLMNGGIRWEKELLANPEDAVVSVTDLRFTAVGYSDL